MPTAKPEYAAVQSLTITLTALGAASARESTAVSNAVNKYLDAFVFVQTKTGAGAIAGTSSLYVYAYGSLDEVAPVYPDTVTGVDAAITLVVPTELRLIGVISAPVNATVYKAGPFSVAGAFANGILPKRWGIVILNDTGTGLDNVAGSHVVKYQGLNVLSE